MYNVISRAYEFILDNNIHKLPVDLTTLSKVCKSCRLHLMPYSLASDIICMLGWEKHMQYDGFTGVADGDTYILYQDALPMGRKMLTIAHEIGHNALGHMDYGVNQRNFNCSPLEQEADMFALCLLAPPCVLQDLGVTSIRDVQTLTYLDENNAKTAFDIMGGYLGTCYDHKVVHCFRSQPKSKIWNGIFACIAAISVVIAGYALVDRYGHNLLTQQPANDPQSTSDALAALKARMSEKQSAQTAPDPKADTSDASETTSNITQNALPEQSEIVYVTRSGEKYHRPGCRYIKNKDTVALTVSEAEADGKTPCSVCFK